MGIAEYFASHLKRTLPAFPSKSPSSYEDMGSAGRPASDPPIELGPSYNPKARRISWLTFLPMPICAAAYATHGYYRRHRPPVLRRPRLTSLRISEMYILLGTVLSLTTDCWLMQRDMIYRDEDLLVVELAAYRMRKLLRDPSNDHFREKVKNGLAELKVALPFPWLTLRDDAYHNANIWQKAVWWHDNVWSNESTWACTAVGMLFQTRGMPRRDALVPDIDPDDWTRCITHLSNRVYEEDIGRYALYPFILFTPIAMFARWTRRPALYLPINGLQRLLLWASIYCADWRAHRRLTSLHNIQERRKAALTVKHVFKYDFKNEIAHCRMWGTIIGPYNSVF